MKQVTRKARTTAATTTENSDSLLDSAEEIGR